MKCCCLLLLLALVSGCAVNHKIMVGDRPVIIQQIISHKGQGKAFVHVHHNEQTALKAAKTVVYQEGGSLITLIHSGGRNIAFHLNHQRFEFDPNRIFTDSGIKKTLHQFGNYTPQAHVQVKKLADKIKHLLPKGKIIAVHNNASYSIKNYMPGHDLCGDVKALYINPAQYYRNFYLVTKISDYLRLKVNGFNGILQKTNATDDGSLSVYLAKNQYINVEAGYDQLTQQIAMLRHA